MIDEIDKAPLCCCEYIDHLGERNHILACCCNCQALDICCDRIVSCKLPKEGQVSYVMLAIMDRIRCPGRNGAFIISPNSYANIFPFIIQPLIAIAIVLVTGQVEVVITIIVLAQALIAAYMAKRNARSQILYYWSISAISYTIILFELSVIPLLEIRWDENLVVVAISLSAVVCLYLTKINAGSVIVDGSLIGNGSNIEDVCNVCRIKVHPRCVHCSICQTCVPRYDHHCFWLDCCIGEGNQVFFLLGLVFGMAALIHGALLILTTICRPHLKYHILLPADCADALDELEMGLCYVAAIYCLGVAFLLLVQALMHFCLVSRGLSGAEWSKHNYSMCAANPYSRGCCRNWLQFFSGLKKLRR